ncbi:MAG: hydrogenase maturation peptidase HycI [Candidatus Aenigmarchaeota archaeon]|nr:hydrogenase maturation peptidase HycI [Candidatus Aenigmarchaeota archaeon]
MNMLMGIGSEINGDDAAGVMVAKRFRKAGWKSVNCETVPENFVPVVRRERPQVLVIVDASDMGLEAGEIRLIPKNRLNSETDSTHSMSLRFLADELEKHAGRILFIGIQPKVMNICGEVSHEVSKAVEKLLDMLQKADFSHIKTL